MISVVPASHNGAPARDLEIRRLAAVRRFGLPNVPSDDTFDRIAELAARMYAAPVALITIVDEERVWFKSRFEGGESSHDDPRQLANASVAESFGFAFHVAEPLRTRDGLSFGTICVMDREPRILGEDRRQALATLASIAADELELRATTARILESEREMLRSATALALRNATQYEQEHNIAHAFQHALLPQFLPVADNVQLDAVYAAADDRDLVGGDWYDAFTIDDGRIMISIGDVGGHGLEAAVWMGKVSQSLRSLSLVITEPHLLLTCLDRLLERYEANILITAFVAVLDPTSGELQYSSAGHSPPFVRTHDGSVSELRSGGVPLGMPMRLRRWSERIMLAPGTIVALYTDGLTEATRNVIEGERSVREALARVEVAESENPAQALRHAVLSRASFDDVAILTIRYGPQFASFERPSNVLVKKARSASAGESALRTSS